MFFHPHMVPALLPAFIMAAVPALRVEEAAVGGRRVVVSFDDSIRAPDLSTLRLSGYSIEHAVFVEESDSLVLSPDLWDLTARGAPRIIRRLETDSATLLLEAAPDWAPRPGIILADTAQGGLLAKIVDLLPSAEGPLPRYWVRTQPAFLNDAVFEGEIRFRMRLDMNALIPDYHGQTEVLDRENGTTGELKTDLLQGRILFQPMTSGVFRFRNGLLERADIRLQGEVEASGRFSANLSGQGRFLHEEIMPLERSFSVPLGHGLCLRAREKFMLRVEAESPEEEVAGHASMRVRHAVSADLAFNFNRWQPTAEAKEIGGEKPVIALQGKGVLRFALEPHLEFLQGGQPGPALTISSVARLSGPNLSAGAADSSGIASGGVAWLRSALFLRAPPMSATSDPQRDFLLFNRERAWAGPPQTGWATIKEGDTGSVTLQCQTDPPSDYFMVQRLSALGAWETILPRAAGPRVRVSGLHPGVTQRLRVIGMNAYGAGPAFPPEGVAYFAPTPVSPLAIPQSLHPDSAAKGDSGLRLTWNIPKAGRGEGVFNVYLGPDSSKLMPVAQSLRDTQVWVPLDSTRPYFWKVEYVEGMRFSESPLRRFAYVSTRPKPALVPVKPPAADRGGMVLIPKGAYRRSDGKTVSVAAFYLQRFEVTQMDYRRVTGSNPSFHVQDSLPVDRVTWEEAVRYCAEIDGRLPTEAEWELAAKAGTRGRFYWGQASPTAYARFRDNSENRTWPVGSLKPNAFGLYDMAGNVFEWTQDWFGEYTGATVNPKGPPAGDAKVIRGASWYSEGRSLDLSARFSNRPGFRNYKVGFRCAMDAPSPLPMAATPAP